MEIGKRAGLAAVVVGALASGSSMAAEWGGLLNHGAPVVFLSQTSAAWLTPSRAVVVGTRNDGGVVRLGASLLTGETWTDPAGTVDEGTSAMHRSPQAVPDGAGHAAVLYGIYSGSVWRLYARWFDGAGFTALPGGPAVDQEGSGNTCSFAGTFVTPTKLLAAYTKDNGSRMALFVRSWNGSEWQDENGGAALDDPAGMGSESPSLAPDGHGGAVVVFVEHGAAGARLAAARLDGTGWHAATGGATMDRPDLGDVASPRVAALADGRWLAVWVQVDADGSSQRLYGSVWTGTSWERVNGGDPLDDYPKGIRNAAIAVDGAQGWIVAYTTEDVVEEMDAPSVRSVRVTGLASSRMNGGETLEAAGARAITSLAAGLSGVGAGGSALLLMGEESGGVTRVYGRAIMASVAATAAAAPAGPVVDGLRVTHNLFRPSRGESARIVCSTSTARRLRLAVYSLAGSPVRVVADGSVAGQAEYAWDGRDDAGQGVSSGVYLLVAEAGSFRDTRKIVVVR